MEVRLATVTSVGSDGQATVTFYGESAASGRKYPYIRNFMPEKDDTVVLIKHGDTYIILGTVDKGELVLQFAKAEHDHKGVYSEDGHTHSLLENGEYGVELSSSGVFVPLKNLAASLGQSGKVFSKIYGDEVFVLTKLTVGDREITSASLGSSSKRFTTGYFTTVYVGTTAITADLIEALQNPTVLASSSSTRKVSFTGAALIPDLNAAVSLGNSSRQFKDGYFTNLYLNGTAVSTSDKRKKKFIKKLPEKFTEFFMKLRPVTFKYKNGTSGRSHVGFIAQEVEQAMQDTGITREEFGGLVIQENGQYGLRYEEFIAIQTQIIQDMHRRVEEVERKVEEIAERN